MGGLKLKLWKVVLINDEFQKGLDALGITKKEIIMEMVGDKEERLFDDFIKLLDQANIPLIRITDILPQHYREQLKEGSLKEILSLEIAEGDYTGFIPMVIK